jgi:predicted RNA-binding protein with PIN domain
MAYVVIQGDFKFICPGADTDWTSVTVTTIGEAADTSDKATNKAMSAALKYALIQTFSVPTKDMDDADRVTVEQAPMPTTEELMARIDKCCSKMGMPREDITEKYRAKHGGISMEAFEQLAPEVLLTFVDSLEQYVAAELAKGGK